MDQEKIGAFIAACRKEAGYTQAALGEKAGDHRPGGLQMGDWKKHAGPVPDAGAVRTSPYQCQ